MQLCSKVIIVFTFFSLLNISLLLGLISNNMSEKVLDLLDEMTVKPDDVTYTVLYNACAHLSNDRAMKIGKKLLNQIPNNFRNNNVVLKSAVHMLMRFGDVTSAEYVFGMTKKDIASYGVMMNGYNQNNEPLKCVKLFEEMKQQDIKLDEIISVLLIDACSQIGMFSLCVSIVAQIPSHFYGKQRVYTSLIDMWASID
jgi:pentatricopeptide repeat protein